MHWIRIALIVNAAVFAVDRIWDLGVLTPMAFVLTGLVYVHQVEGGGEPGQFVVAALVVLAALTVLDLLDAGVLPVIRI